MKQLYKSVKTNCCFFATEDTQKLQKFKSRLLYKYKINISEKEKKWIKTILNYVNPRIIICEGFGAFNSLKKIFLKERKHKAKCIQILQLI